MTANNSRNATPLSMRRTSENIVKRIISGSFLLVLAGLAACGPKKEADFPIPVDKVAPRDIQVTADATGKIEPIQIIEIKSKAGGTIDSMPVDVGSVASRRATCWSTSTRRTT